MTTLFDDIADVYTYSDSDDVRVINALDNLSALLIQYHELAPKWAEAPEWAQWYAINPNNRGFWFDAPEPLINFQKALPQWINNSRRTLADHVGLLPFGIDWRLCKWQRPTVQS